MRDDAGLIDATRSGDTESFGQLVQKYQDRLFNSLIHALGDRQEAEDVTQDAFLQAYRKLGSFQGRSEFYTWLYRIAFNLSVSRRRRKRPEVNVNFHNPSVGLEPREQIEASTDRLLRQERAQQVHEALAKLTTEHRTILVLREMDGCCYDTIAEMLDLPVGTVRSRLHRARAQMRNLLKEVLQ